MYTYNIYTYIIYTYIIYTYYVYIYYIFGRYFRFTISEIQHVWTTVVSVARTFPRSSQVGAPKQCADRYRGVHGIQNRQIGLTFLGPLHQLDGILNNKKWKKHCGNQLTMELYLGLSWLVDGDTLVTMRHAYQWYPTIYQFDYARLLLLSNLVSTSRYGLI